MSQHSQVNVEDGVVDLSKRNTKLERMVERMHTRNDDATFRTLLEKELRDGKALCVRLLTALKAHRSDATTDNTAIARVANAFAREFKTFERLTAQAQKNDREAIAKFRDLESGQRVSDAKTPLLNGSGDGNGKHSSRTDIKQTQLQQQQQQQQQLAADEVDWSREDVQELEQRYRKIEQIERDVELVGEMFSDTLKLLQQQGVVIDQIGDNIKKTHANVIGANKELNEAEEIMRRNRRRKCGCIFALLLIAVIIVVVAVLAH